MNTGDFIVEMRRQGEDWQPLPVTILPVGSGTITGTPFPPEVLREFGGIEEGVTMTLASLCLFFWEEPVEVRVTAPGFDGELGISARSDIPFRRSAPGRVEFTLDGPEMLLIRKGDDYVRGLSLWARPMPAAPSKTAPLREEGGPAGAGGSAARQILRFGPGFHTAGNSPLIGRDRYGAPVVPITGDDTLVVIEPGARVEAAFDIRGAKRVEICGGGCIDLTARLPHAGSGFPDAILWGAFREGALPAVYVHGGAEDVTVRDLVMICDFRGVCTRFASRVRLSNLGIFTTTTNADGVNMCASEDIAADSLYIRSQDDCFCAYNNCDSIPWLWDEGMPLRPMRRASLTRSLVGCNCRAFVFGGHGFSGVRGEPNVLEEIEVSDCRVLGNVAPHDKPPPPEAYRRRWSGIFRILSQSDELVRNLRFHDIVVEWVPGYAGSAYHLCVRTKEQVSYKEKTGGWRIEDVSFKDIEWRNVPPPGRRIEDVLAAPPDDGTGIGIRRIQFPEGTP